MPPSNGYTYCHDDAAAGAAFAAMVVASSLKDAQVTIKTEAGFRHFRAGGASDAKLGNAVALLMNAQHDAKMCVTFYRAKPGSFQYEHSFMNDGTYVLTHHASGNSCAHKRNDARSKAHTVPEHILRAAIGRFFLEMATLTPPASFVEEQGKKKWRVVYKYPDNSPLILIFTRLNDGKHEQRAYSTAKHGQWIPSYHLVTAHFEYPPSA